MNLRTYLQLGMRLTKIHRVLSFTQSNFLKTYIDICTQLRQKATTEFGKRLFKLFSNSVFGKFIEQTRNYLNVSFSFNDEKRTMKEISNVNFSNFKILSKNLIAIFKKQKSILLNKPLPIGFTILERSKDYMFRQFYMVIRKKLPATIVLMSDTDSLCLAITNTTLQEKNILRCLAKIMDFSNHPKTSLFYSAKNKNKLGFWKDELKGARMTEFVGIRSKTYAYLLNDEKKKVYSKCKGITKAYKKTIRFEIFKHCITHISKKTVRQYRIQSKNHIIHTLKIRKVAFTSFDDKRYLLPCGIHSVPYGSVLIQKAIKNKKCCFCDETVL